MGLQKNVASQKWVVFAFDRTDNTPKTGDAAQITANLRIDGGAANGVDDTNPTELEDGFYAFDLSQAETNGDYIVICPASSTGDIQVIGCPMAQYTVPPNFNALSIASGRVDMGSIAGSAVSTASAQLGVNVVNVKGIDAETRLFELAKNEVNLLTNGGFETGDPPDDWALAGAGATFAQSAVQKKVGSYSGLLTRNGTDCYIYQNTASPFPYIGIEATAKMWVYATVASRVRLWFGTDVAGSNSSYHTGAAGWELLTVTHTIEAAASLIQLQCRIENGDTSAYVDEAVMAAPFNDLTSTEVDMALSDYDAPTKAELDTGLAGLNDLSAADVNAEVDTALSDYDPPTKAEVDASIASAHSTTDALIGALNDLSAAQVWSYAARVLTANTNLNDPSAATIKTAVEAAGSHLALIKAETDKLADTLEDDGGTYRFTENALEEAPSGTGGDATAANQVAILAAIAVAQADLDNPDQYKAKSIEL